MTIHTLQARRHGRRCHWPDGCPTLKPLDRRHFNGIDDRTIRATIVSRALPPFDTHYVEQRRAANPLANAQPPRPADVQHSLDREAVQNNIVRLSSVIGSPAYPLDEDRLKALGVWL